MWFFFKSQISTVCFLHKKRGSGEGLEQWAVSSQQSATAQEFLFTPAVVHNQCGPPAPRLSEHRHCDRPQIALQPSYSWAFSTLMCSILGDCGHRHEMANRSCATAAKGLRPNPCWHTYTLQT